MTLALWPPCAVRSCLCFVPVRGQVCAWCLARQKRLDRQMAMIADVLAVRARRPWLRGTLRTLYPIWARGGHLRGWWQEYTGAWIGRDEDARP